MMRRFFSLLSCWLIAWGLAATPVAAQDSPDIAVVPSMVPPGGLVDVIGRDWHGTCGVNLRLDADDGPFLGFAAVEQDSGAFQRQVVVPDDADPGEHRVVAVGLGFGVEFCGGPDGTRATAPLAVEDPASDEPRVTLSALEGTPGSTVEVSGAGFCADPGCSAVQVWFGGALAAQDIEVGDDGMFVADVVLPVVSPLGRTELFAVQTDAAGQERFGYAEFETTVRPGPGAAPPPPQGPPVIGAAPPAGGAVDGEPGQPPPGLTGAGQSVPSSPALLVVAVGVAAASAVAVARRRTGPRTASGPAAPSPPVAVGTAATKGLRTFCAALDRPSGRLRPRSPRLASGLAAAAVAAGLLVPTGAVADPPASAVTDVNPDGLPAEPRFGGRALGLTVDPTDASRVYVASELGGIWRSADGGTNWTHVDAVNLTVARDVTFDPQDASVLVATGRSNGSTTTPEGILVSSDGGASWSQPATALAPCNTQPGAWGIAIADDAVAHTNVYVATDCGIAISGDSGGTWTHTDPCTAADAAYCKPNRPYFDVVAQVVGGDVQLDVCGDEGFFRSPDGGATWTAPDPASPSLNPPNRNPCHVATAPGDPNTVFLANWSGVNASGFCTSQLLESNDGGATWAATALTDANCRDAWVVTAPANDGDANHFEAYVGTSNRVRTQHCDLGATPRCAPAVASWPQADSGAHADPSDIAFDPANPGCPTVLSTDGGMSTSTDCGATWVDGNRGYHALDIRALAGTVHGGHTDLYIGTQDNGMYASQDNAASWARPVGADAYNVLADATAPGRVFYRQCFGCNDFIGDEHVAGVGAFPDPPGVIGTTAVATQFGPQRYAFITSDGATPPTFRVWVTTDEGGNWTQMGPALPGNPGEIKAAGPAGSPTLYLRLNVGGALRIYRLSGALDATATLALANAGLAGPTWAWDVDPSTPMRLVAADVNLGQMMVSTNGGASWTPDAALTNLVTRGGTYPFATAQTGSQPRAVALDANSGLIVVGTATAGLVASADEGGSWTEVPGGQILPRSRDFFFDPSDGAVYAATQGRGIWRLDLPLADLSITKTDNPDPAVAGEQLTYELTVSNAGPDTAHEIVVTETLPAAVDFVADTAPGGCVEAPPGTLTCTLGDLAATDALAFSITVDVDPAAVFDNGGPFSMTNTATVFSAVLEADSTDNTAAEDTDVVAVADLEILSFAALDAPDQIIVGQDVDVKLRKVITNHGPSAPMDVRVTAAASGTPGATVTPANVVTVAPAVALDEERVVEETFTLSCEEASNHTFTFSNTIAPANPADTDPDLSNNDAEVSIDVLCVVPVQINIKPGSDPNSVQLDRSTVTVAVLTTAAGEYGLPLAFDATTIDPLSVRFGPADVVFNGLGGASERHGRGHIEDSRELDESTRDGDLDMVLHFRASDTGLQPDDTEACVYGTWIDAGGDVHALFGCDTIRVVPPG